MNTEKQVFTAAQLAAALGISKRAVRKTLGCMDSSTLLVDGQEAKAWPFSQLPLDYQERLAQQPFEQPWQPDVPFDQASDAAREAAFKLQRALERSLRSLNDTTLTPEEFLSRGLADYKKAFNSPCTRQWFNKLLKRTIDRDRGAQNWGRLELYLSERVAIKRQRPVLKLDERGFSFLHDIISRFKNPLDPDLVERAYVWVNAFEHLEEFPVETRPMVKVAALKFLSRHAFFLGATPETLRRNFDRKYDRWVKSDRDFNTLIDARAEKSGFHRVPDITEDDKKLIIAFALKFGGGISQAWRELMEQRKLSPIITAYYSKGANKSYVPKTVRYMLRHKVRMLQDFMRGPRTVGLNGAYTERDVTTIAAGDLDQSDDVTFPNYFWDENPDGSLWVGRGQVLIWIDVRSLYIYGINLIPENVYSAFHIRNSWTSKADEYGLPRIGFYLERGTWKKARLLKGKEDEVGWSETEMGLRRLGLRFVHANFPKGKVIEPVLGILQNFLQAAPGYVGRNERSDKYERVQEQLSDARNGKVHPRRWFYSKVEWLDILEGACSKFNLEVQHGKHCPNISPKDAYEQFFSTKLVKIPDECRHLLASNKIRTKVGRNGITFKFGRESFTYKNQRTGELIGQEVIAWFNPENPDVLAATDLDGCNPFVIHRATKGDYIGFGEASRQAKAENAAHEQYRRVLYRSIRPLFSEHFSKARFRDNIIDESARQLGREIEQQTEIVKRENRQETTRNSESERLLEMVRSLQSPTSTQPL